MLELPSIKATTLRREVVRIKQNTVNRQKVEVKVKKQQRNSRVNNLSIKDHRYYDSNTYGTDLDPEDGYNIVDDSYRKNLVPLC